MPFADAASCLCARNNFYIPPGAEEGMKSKIQNANAFVRVYSKAHNVFIRRGVHLDMMVRREAGRVLEEG